MTSIVRWRRGSAATAASAPRRAPPVPGRRWSRATRPAPAWSARSGAATAPTPSTTVGAPRDAATPPARRTADPVPAAQRLRIRVLDGVLRVVPVGREHERAGQHAGRGLGEEHVECDRLGHRSPPGSTRRRCRWPAGTPRPTAAAPTPRRPWPTPAATSRPAWSPPRQYDGNHHDTPNDDRSAFSHRHVGAGTPRSARMPCWEPCRTPRSARGQLAPGRQAGADAPSPVRSRRSRDRGLAHRRPAVAGPRRARRSRRGLVVHTTARVHDGPAPGGGVGRTSRTSACAGRGFPVPAVSSSARSSVPRSVHAWAGRSGSPG